MPPTRLHVQLSVALVVSALASPAVASSANGDDFIPTPPKEFEGIGVTEHVGTTIPLDLPFRDEQGRDVVLGDSFHDDLPVLLTFNYSNCPMLCSQQLHALSGSLARLDFTPGQQFRIVTIDLDPLESPARAAEARKKYLDDLPPARRTAAGRGWTFLVARHAGDDAQIRKLAAAVGFSYRYIPAQNQYAHPAALIFLSSRGIVTRYLGGIDYPEDTLHESIVHAGLAEASTSAGFFLTCFHYEPGGRAHAAVVTMQIAAAIFIAVCIAIFFGLRVMRRQRFMSR